MRFIPFDVFDKEQLIDILEEQVIIANNNPFGSRDDELVQEFDALNAILNTQASAYYKAQAKVYGDKAREAYKLYNTANAHYRQMIALGLPTDRAVDMVQRALNVYHNYEHMCSEFSAKAHLVMQVC